MDTGELTQSQSLFRRAKEHIPGGVNSPVRAFRGVGGEPFFVDSAAGARLHTVDGRELIDYVGTWGPAILGHAPQVVVEAVRETAGRATSFGIPNPLEVEMAELICDWVPSVEKVRMVNSGTEATMSCIRLARGFTGRDRVIKFAGCYHGHVDSLLVKAGSGALTHGEPDSAGVPAAFADLTVTLPFNDIAAVEQALEAYPDEVAAIILEPLPANAGLIPPVDGYLDQLHELTQKHGVVLIFDEVMTGFRVAKGGYQELCGVTPDLTAMGKVIGGGLPVGAFGGRAEIMDYLSPDGPVYQAGTLSGNPLAMAAGLAQLRELERRDGWQQLAKLGQAMADEVTSLIKHHDLPLTYHHCGSMFCLFFSPGPIRNIDDALACDKQAFARYFHACLDAGVYFAPSQFEAGFISLAHTIEDLKETARVVTQTLKSIGGK